MEQQLTIYNTLDRKKELFVPLHAPHVGMYVCGPTVYGDPHLGHARPAITFDLLFRYLTHIGYKVRYVRNITDVGHLEHDADDGEDKIAKKARLEQLEPMEVAQYYINRYHQAMDALNVLSPSIEPHASGHIIEQIALVKEIMKNGYAYESEGSVYFDVAKYNKDHHYGKLSGRNLDDVLNTSRELDGQSEKHNPADFALWKCAQPEHIMRWPSPWSDGFPGWHCECTAMGKKYLGEHFDIHGGGMDLIFPHHENEIAQSECCNGVPFAHYWMHNGYINVDNKKMSKSLGNFFTVRDVAEKYGYEPIRYLMVSSHYRMPINYSVEIIEQCKASLERLYNCKNNLEFAIENATVAENDGDNALIEAYDKHRQKFISAMDDDLNTADAITVMFELAKDINTNITNTPSKKLAEESLKIFMELANVLGLLYVDEKTSLDDEIEALIAQRNEARKNKDWATADKIRDELKARHIVLEDTPQGVKWKIVND